MIRCARWASLTAPSRCARRRGVAALRTRARQIATPWHVWPSARCVTEPLDAAPAGDGLHAGVQRRAPVRRGGAQRERHRRRLDGTGGARRRRVRALQPAGHRVRARQGHGWHGRLPHTLCGHVRRGQRGRAVPRGAGPGAAADDQGSQRRGAHPARARVGTGVGGAERGLGGGEAAQPAPHLARLRARPASQRKTRGGTAAVPPEAWPSNGTAPSPRPPAAHRSSSFAPQTPAARGVLRACRPSRLVRPMAAATCCPLGLTFATRKRVRCLRGWPGGVGEAHTPLHPGLDAPVRGWDGGSRGAADSAAAPARLGRC